MKRVILLFLLLGNLVTQAQIKVGNNPTTINSSAVLDVESTTKGFLPPRMTTLQRDQIPSPAVGLVVFNTDTKTLEVNTGSTATPVWSSNKSGEVNNTTLTSSSSPAGTSTGQMMYNTGSVQPTGLVYWDGTQWKSVASSGGNTTNNYTVVNNKTVTNNDSVINNNPVVNNDTVINNGPVYNTTKVTNDGPVINNNTSTFNGTSTFNNTSTFNKKAVFNDTAVFTGGMKVSNLPEGLPTDSILVFEPTTKVMRRISVTGASASGEPWYKVGTTSGATANTDNVFLNGRVGIGTDNPQQTLDVAGTFAVRMSALNGGTQNIQVQNSAGLNRWSMGMGPAETGSNNGGDFNLWGYADDGSYLNNPLTVTRSTGNVSIGTTYTPGRLNIGGTTPSTSNTYSNLMALSATDGVIGHLYNAYNGTANYLGLQSFLPNDPGGKTPVVLNEWGGKVGIGTNNPGGRLHVAGDATGAGWDNSSIWSSHTGTGGHSWAFGARSVGTAGDFAISDETDGVIRATIQGGTGNVGIGTGAPVEKLDVNGNVNVSGKIVLPASDNIKINLMGSDNSARIVHENGWTVANYASQQGVVSSGQFAWYNTDAAGNYIERMRISNTGRINIGTTSDYGSRLNIGGTTASTTAFYDPLVTLAATDGPIGTLYHSHNGSKSYLGLQSFSAGDTEKTPIVLGEWGGNVGIGTNNPVAKLHVDGSAYFTNLSTNAGFVINANANRTYLQYLGTAGSNTALVLTGRGNGNEDITINGATGYVGILNNAPKAPLHIGGTTASSFTTAAQTYFNYNSGALFTAASSSARTDASLITEGNVWTKGSMFSAASLTFSDRRIKNIIGQSNASKDLDLLNKIRITDYRMKDVVMQGNKQYKKVIAQEVEAIYPEAVTQQTGFVPNIYQLADKVQNMGNNTYKASFKNKVEYNKNVTGDIKLYDEHKEITAKLVSKGDNEIVFTTTDAINGDKLFLFGEEVTDFRAVDYEALSTLNISATQELYREIQALKKQNTELMANITEMKKLESAYVQLAAQVKEMQQVLSLTGKQNSSVAVVK